MVDEPEARELAKARFDEAEVVFGEARELEHGWYFPGIAKTADFLGGVFVNKQTGEAIWVLSDSPMAEDPTLYDRGYRYDQYDLVVLEVEDLEKAVRVIAALHIVTQDVYYKYDRVWRVGRRLMDVEVRQRLATLPAVFTGRFNHGVGELEAARKAGWFEFKLLEYRGRESKG